LRATEDELMGIASGIRDAGTGVMEFISDFDTPDQESEFAMIRRLVETSGRPLSLSLAQTHGRPENWRSLLGLIEGAAKDGLAMRGQVASRPIGVLYGLQASLNPFATLPSYRAIADRTLAERLAAMRDPAFRARILGEAEAAKSSASARRLMAFDRMFALGTPPDYEPPREKSIASIAARLGRDPEGLAYDMLLEDDGRAFLFAPFANYAYFNLDACGEMIDSPHTVMGLGDGGAHVGLISDASFSTYLLTHWGRDRTRGRFDLARLVRRQTSDTAHAVGLMDRGVIAPGKKADINVIDFDRLALEAPVMSFDLPAGGKRLLQRARGYAATIVSGQAIYRDGETTGALPGRLVRGARP
jgi:N-acyl-D-aspartate/D-glutamate deacylase